VVRCFNSQGLIDMRRRNWIKISILVVAVLCNAGLFCWLIVGVLRARLEISKMVVPVLVGLFFILNLLALTLSLRSIYKSTPTSMSSARRFSKLRWMVLSIVVLGCIGLGFWAGFSFHDRIGYWKWQRARQAKIEKFMGKKAPEVVTQTLEGAEWKLEDLRGKVVVMDFWATWCGPCVAALPDMKRLYEKYKSREDFVMVGVSLDWEKEKVVKFCEEREIGWLQLFEADKNWQNSVARAFETYAIPSVWVIDKEGSVAGMDLHGEAIERAVEKSLTEGQGGEGGI